MDTSTSSEELDTSIESLSSSIIEGQTVLTPHRPSPFTLRSQCANAKCPHGKGIQFRSRISPSPSKQRVRSSSRRRRRRSDHHNTSDSSSFLEISHQHNHHHHHHHHHDHYPHDGIHNIDHHHVHHQDVRSPSPISHTTPEQLTQSRRAPDTLKARVIRFDKQAPVYYSPDTYLNTTPVITRADILFEEMQQEEERRRSALKEIKERTVTSSETTTTTVRKTSNGGPQGDVNGGIVSNIAESVKSTVIGFLTPTQNKSLPAIVESRESGFEGGTVIGDKRQSPETNEAFRPAREFFDEADTRERLTSDYFSGSDTPSKLRESTRRLSIRKPYNKYIAYSSDEEFDEWKEQPKSDYTYSTSLTYRSRVTPDRKIGSPNMSRRTLKGGNIIYEGSPDFTSSSEASFNTFNLRSRRIVKPMDAFSDTSDGEEVVERQSPPRNRRSTRSRSFEMSNSNGSLTRTITTTQTEYTTTKTLHTGLDAESDVDDHTESAVPARSVPILGRGGTPLGRAITPLPSLKLGSSRRSSFSGMDVGKGYTIGEGTIAEDVEGEDEEEAQRNIFWRWSNKTVTTVTRITTIIAASVAMVAARAVTAVTSPPKDKVIDLDEKQSSASFVEVIKAKYYSGCERLRKNPILIWIPLLLILLLLALAAYWWLLQSQDKTAGASEPTENDGPSFPFTLLSLVTNLGSSLYSGVSSFFISFWLIATESFYWLGSAVKGTAQNTSESLVNLFSWLGSLTIFCLAWLWSWIVLCFTFVLDLLYLVWDYLRYGGLSVYSFTSSSASNVSSFASFSASNIYTFASSSASNIYTFASSSATYVYTFLLSSASSVYNLTTSSASYLYSLLPFTTSDESANNGKIVNKESINIFAAFANFSPTDYLSKAYVAIAEGTQSSGTMLWNAWMWLLVSTGDILSLCGTYTLSFLSSIWAAIFYVLTGLWTLLTYILLALVTIVGAPVRALMALAPNKSSPVSTTIEETVIKQPLVMDMSQPKIEEIVEQVLNNEQLKGFIAAAIAEKAQGQLTVDDVSETAKLLIEQELKGVKADLSTLGIKVDANAAASREEYAKIIQLREEKANLIKDLELLGQRLYNVEGKLDVADKKSIQDNQEIEEKVQKIIQQISRLEEDHINLAANVKSCCDDKKVPMILGEIFGIPPNGTEGDVEQPDIGAWLKTYFVAKEELDLRLNDLLATMQVKPDDDTAQAATTQTTQMIMATVLAKLQEEMVKQQEKIVQESREARESVSKQIDSEVQAAAGILGEQISQQVQSQNQQLKESVNSAVQQHVSVAVETAVHKAVETAIASAVPEAVDRSVPEAVKDILPNIVSEEVASSVPDIVSSVLPAAVTSAVSEAMVHVSETKQGEEAIEVNINSGRNNIVGITGSASANMTQNGSNDGTVFVPGMHFTGGLNETEVLKIVQAALRKYDADKTGMVDHALETAGGNIVSTRCTESYQEHQAELRILGFPIYRYSTNNPRTVIQPDTMPGQCWAFKGSQGYIVIRLSGYVKPTGFTLEHIPKSLSPNGAIDSAPNEFEVLGLNTENDEGVPLGKFKYSENGEPLQYFPVTVENEEYFPHIELIINSNHGNLKYTCLYRFRVHGVLYLE